MSSIGTVVEFANIVDVPILKAGDFPSHNAGVVSISEAELDRTLEGSRMLHPLILEAIQTGVYRGNEGLSEKIGKTIPGLLNLNHQAPFKESPTLSQVVNEKLKQAIQNISVDFRKANIKGEDWIVERFLNVPDDIAKTLQESYPYRSVELIPLTDPESGEKYDHVIRSTAFLDHFTPPAVDGQNSDLIVEFQAGSPLQRIVSHQPYITEEIIMAENTELKELQARTERMEALMKERQELMTELQKKLAEEKAAREQANELAAKAEQEKDEKIAELQEIQNRVESETLISNLQRSIPGHVVTPAFLEVTKPMLMTPGVIELQEGENFRQGMARVLKQVVELASKNAILVPVETQGAPAYSSPDGEPKTESEKVEELMKKNPDLSQRDAFIKVLNAEYGGK